MTINHVCRTYIFLFNWKLIPLAATGVPLTVSQVIRFIRHRAIHLGVVPLKLLLGMAIYRIYAFAGKLEMST